MHKKTIRDDSQCAIGERCIPDISGLLHCQEVLEQIPITPKQIICQNDPQCNTFNKCIYNGWYDSCQYGPSELKIPGTINDQCRSNADCSQDLHCIDKNGIMTCQIIATTPSYKICQSDADCDTLHICSFNKQYNINLCVKLSEYQSTRIIPPFPNGNNIGNGVIPSNLIDNGATENRFEKQCTADYQCSIFEICATEKNIQGNRICKYNPTANNRQCRFNADCKVGQLCEKVFENVYLCRNAKHTTFMQPCNYDYECSNGQHCININNNMFFQQNVRYCYWLNEGTICEDDSDCKDGKVCRVSGKFKQCISMISSSHLTL
ncbi:hypothetical protein DINM_000947 [Dirofilaria immitis]|nr:hypothetical protein [Dirofilaria immitis]